MTNHTEALNAAILAAGFDPRNPAVREAWQAGIDRYLEEIEVPVKEAMKRLYVKLAEEGGGNWAIDVIMDVERIVVSAGGEKVKGWQQIETAPKDDSNVLAWFEKLGEFHIVQWNSEEEKWASGTWVYYSQPTHWMPIDSPTASLPTDDRKEKGNG
jgi:hypothetical protein